MLDSEAVLDRFLQELAVELAGAGRGIQSRLQRSLGLRTGYIHDMFRRRYVELGKAVAIIDALGLDVPGFLERVLGPASGVVEAFAREALQEGGAMPAIVQQAAARFHERAPFQASTTGRTTPYAYRLQNLEECIDRNPHEAVGQAETHIASSLEIAADGDAVEPVARGLGYYATACSRSGRPRAARQALGVGLQIASAYGLKAVTAELVRRGVAMLRRSNANVAAMRLVAGALWLSEALDDTEGRALALTEKGLLLERAGRPNAAKQTLTEVLSLLPEDAGKPRFTALWALTRIAWCEGELEEAERHAAEAADLASTVGGPSVGWFLRLRAEIAARRNAAAQAEAYLEEAHRAFAESAEPHGLALVATARIRRQRRRHEEAEACAAAKRLLPSLLTALARNRSVTHSLTRLLTAAQENHLTAEAIDRVEQAVRQTDPETHWR